MPHTKLMSGEGRQITLKMHIFFNIAFNTRHLPFKYRDRYLSSDIISTWLTEID